MLSPGNTMALVFAGQLPKQRLIKLSVAAELSFYLDAALNPRDFPKRLSLVISGSREWPRMPAFRLFRDHRSRNFQFFVEERYKLPSSIFR